MKRVVICSIIIALVLSNEIITTTNKISQANSALRPIVLEENVNKSEKHLANLVKSISKNPLIQNILQTLQTKPDLVKSILQSKIYLSAVDEINSKNNNSNTEYLEKLGVSNFFVFPPEEMDYVETTHQKLEAKPQEGNILGYGSVATLVFIFSLLLLISQANAVWCRKMARTTFSAYFYCPNQRYQQRSNKTESLFDSLFQSRLPGSISRAKPFQLQGIQLPVSEEIKNFAKSANYENFAAQWRQILGQVKGKNGKNGMENGMMSPGMMSPGMMSPGMMPPGMGNGMTLPGLMMPPNGNSPFFPMSGNTLFSTPLSSQYTIDPTNKFLRT